MGGSYCEVSHSYDIEGRSPPKTHPTIGQPDITSKILQLAGISQFNLLVSQRFEAYIIPQYHVLNISPSTNRTLFHVALLYGRSIELRSSIPLLYPNFR